MRPTIVVSAYNRPHALRRLLNALQEAHYPGDQVSLHISVDGGEGQAAQAVRQLGREFSWSHGPKQVVCHPKNLGLLQHFFLCGDLAIHYGSIILLEDDLLVSPQFYKYATQALDYFNHDERIAGISLYSLWFNGYTHFPFVPMPDASDIFFLQIPYTQGQAFTREQWQRFKDWRRDAGNGAVSAPGLHEMFTRFDEQDWFPLRTRYLVDTNRYYVFPHISLATGFGDAGTHFSSPSLFFQVPLQDFQSRFRLQPFDQAPAVYDSFFEILPERLNRLTNRFQGYDYCVDLNATKSRQDMQAEFALTVRPALQSVMEFGRVMWPPEANLISGVPGEGIRLSRLQDLSWGRLPDMAIRKSNFDYTSRNHPVGKKTLLQFTLYEWFKRFQSFIGKH
jgi:hypothetical protein